MVRFFPLSPKRIFSSNPTIGKLGSIDLNLSLLQWFGLPLFHSKGESNIFLIIYGILILSVLRVPFHLCQIYDLVLCWGDFDKVIQNICITLLHLGGGLKTIIVFFRLVDVHKIIKQFKWMTRKYVRSENQKEVFALLEHENKMFLTLYACTIGSSALIAMVMVFLDPLTFVGKLFPYRAKFPDIVPFDVQTVYAPVAVFVTGIQIVATDYLNVTFINLTRCQLQMLNLSFDELNENIIGQVATHPVKFLRNLVEHHNHILSIRKQIESVFKIPMLVQFTISLFIYGMTGFQALVRSNTSGLVMIYFYAGCILVQLLICCWFGNEVSEQNKTLAQKAYDTAWYNLDSQFKKSLILFLASAQRPLIFTAGGFFDLSMETFSKILSKSYTFVAVLRQQYTGGG